MFFLGLLVLHVDKIYQMILLLTGLNLSDFLIRGNVENAFSPLIVIWGILTDGSSYSLLIEIVHDHVLFFLQLILKLVS